jgi:hypothetical protein
MEVFPNPFHEELFIQNDQREKSNVVIDVYAMNGTKIFSQKFTTIKANEKHKLNLKENLSAGIYLLKVMMDGQRSFSKIVKQ